ncbi:GNAT family N-acetyltransferase [Algoriphagus formosus]|uniref:GNAT family N-acetyltransferase n=1 Tax=Algoriphagus formosus TaxID=2007308 RepID=A0A4R5URT1_9BACT|nr:GNAT family N-acetyltransferase [Algoriphagus aquimaris]TDK41691.1 GNAT family N-acetyltransferase [Algoriphagus aquimaris]
MIVENPLHLPSLGQIHLAPIQISDQGKLYELMGKVYRDAYQPIWTDRGAWYVDLIYGRETLEKELKRERSHYFFIEVEGQRAGVFKYDFPFSPRETPIPSAMKIHRLYLDSRYHGTGLAKLLMDYAERIARGNKLENIWLEAMSCQPQAKRFYEKCGFEVVHSYQLDFERIYPEFREILIMRKKLTN